MRIHFEFEWEIADGIDWLKQKRLDLICKVKGHQWEKYKKPKNINSIYERWNLASMLYGRGWAEFGYGEDKFEKKPTHKCKRCGEYKYKLIKRKPKTVKWIRYSKK